MTNRRIRFPTALHKNLSEYREQTTIHGVKYLTNRSRPLCHSIYWMITFILSILLLGYFVYNIGRTWQKNEVVLRDRIKSTQVYEIPFPAVTICPQIKFKKDKLNLLRFYEDTLSPENNTSEIKLKLTMALQICRSSFLKHMGHILHLLYEETGFIFAQLNNEWMDTLQEISPSVEDVFVTCQMIDWTIFGGPPSPFRHNCETLFSMVITNEGVCFTFNSIRDLLRADSLHTDFQYHNITRTQDGWDPEIGYTKADAYPYKAIVGASPSVAGGLEIVLSANRSDITPFCQPPNIGYKIALHPPTEYPQTYDNFIPITFGKEYQIAVLPKTIETSEDLRSLSPEQRGCYFNGERKLKFYTFYNENNCRLECYANYTEDYFGGVPFSSPRDAKSKNLMLPFRHFGWHLPGFFEMAKNHFNEFGKPDVRKEIELFTECGCLPACNSIHYDNKIMKLNEDFSLQSLNSTRAKMDNDMVQTTIQIIFDKPNFKGQQRVRIYTFDTMLSDFGGFLGLFLGGSMLSLFELFYFLIIRNCCKVKSDD